MRWLQSILYGIVSGLTEFLPISSSAHRQIMGKLYGISTFDPVLDFFIHVGLLAAVFITYRSTIESALGTRRVRSRRRSVNDMDHMFVRTAAVPLVLFAILMTYISKENVSLLSVAGLSLINGLLLFLQGRTLQGNKTAGAMSAIDSSITGILRAMWVFPGLSGVAVATTYGIVRGADRQKALNWAFLLSIPVLLVKLLLDFIRIFSAFTPVAFVVYIGYLVSAAFAFLSGYLAITLMRFLAVRTGFSGFAYYCWGLSLLSFFLYLI